MHIRDNTNEDTSKIDVLNRDIERFNRDIERLKNSNKKYLDKINRYKERLINQKEKYDKNINNLKNDLIDQEYAKKELQKLYENLKDDNKRLSGYVEKHIDLLVGFNHLKIDNERTENKLNEIRIDSDKIVNELHENTMEIAALKSASETDKKILNKNKEDIKRYISIIYDSKKTIKELERKLLKENLDNKNELIKEIEELKEYKEKYEELLDVIVIRKRCDK